MLLFNLSICSNNYSSHESSILTVAENNLGIQIFEKATIWTTLAQCSSIHRPKTCRTGKINYHKLTCYFFLILLLFFFFSFTESQNHIGWKGPWRSSSPTVNLALAVSNYTISLSAMSMWLLNTSRDGDSTTALGSPFQCLTTHSVKKYFLISSLNLPWCNLRPLPLVLSLITWLKRLIPSSLQPPFR